MIGEVLDVDLAVGFCVALLSSAMTAYAGFGGALIMVSLLTLLFGPVQAVALMAICGIVGQAQVLPSLAKDARWADVAPLCAALVVAIALGTRFLVSADPRTIRLGIGVFVLLSAAILMSKIDYRGPRGAVPGTIVGLLTGCIMGGFGVPAGPVLVVYYLASPDPPRVQRANILLGGYTMVAVALISLLARDAVDAATFHRAVFIAPGSIAGAALGRYLFRVVPAAWFRHVAHWALVAIGLSVFLG